MARKNSVEITVSLKDAVTKGLSSVQRSLTSMKKSVLNLKTALAGVGSVLAVKSLMDASTEQTKSVMGLETALKAMGRYTPELSQKLQDLASAEQGVTNYGDEMTMVGMKFLVTYRNITDDLLPQTTKTMLDLAALMGGDLVSAANMLGKASMGMVSNLRRVGISVDAATYKEEGFAGVLREINAQVKGQSQAMRQAVGPWTAISNVIGDMKEKAGDIAKEVLNPLGDAVLTMLGDVDSELNDFKNSANLHTWAKNARNSIMDAVESTILGVAGFSDAVKPMIKTVSEVGSKMYAGFKELPKWIQDVGLLVAIFGGKTGMVVLGTLSSLSREIEIQMAGLASATVGVISWKELIFSTNAELEKLLKNKNILDRKPSVSIKNPKGPVVHPGANGRYAVPEDPSESVDPESATHAAQAWIAKFRDAFTAAEGSMKETVTSTMGKVTASAKNVVGSVSLASRAKAELAMFQAQQKTVSAEMDKALDDHLISVKEYYDKKDAMADAANRAEVEAIRTKYGYEIDELKKQIANENDLAAVKKLKDKRKEKELALSTELYGKEQSYLQELIRLEKERVDAVEKANDDREKVQSLTRDAEDENYSAGDYGGDYRQDIQPRLEREMEAFKARQAQRLEDLEDAGASEVEIARVVAQQKEALAKKEAKAEYDVLQQRLSWSSTFAGDAAGIFKDLAESGIGNSKKMFGVYKAIAIAETTISTYSAAMGAYKSASEIPYVGWIIGPIAAAAAIAMGMAKVAAIKSSSPSGYAFGGLIDGPDRGDRADNVTIKATPGEYMMDRPTVQHYGLGVMEAMRSRVIPRSAFLGMSVPASPMLATRSAYATGGQVGPGTVQKQEAAPKVQNTTIVNVTDKSELDRYMASVDGQNAIMNVISAKNRTVRRLVVK